MQSLIVHTQCVLSCYCDSIKPHLTRCVVIQVAAIHSNSLTGLFSKTMIEQKSLLKIVFNESV